MSSKNGDPNKRATEPLRAAHMWSIKARLTVFYSVSLLAILSLASGYLYWVLTTNFRDAGESFLGEEIRELRAMLRGDTGDLKTISAEIASEEGMAGFAKHHVRVLDAQGQVMLDNGELRENLPPDLFPPPIPVGRNQVQCILIKARNGVPYLLTAGWAESGENPTVHRIIQVALDTSHQAEIVAVYRRRIALVLILGVVVSAVVSAAVAHRGLRPLHDIERATERVTATQLHERIGSARWPHELCKLATAFDAMLGRLEESFTRLSQFSSDLAHELRTPIQNLRGETEVALSKSRTADEYRQVLEANLEEYEQMSRMTEGLLFLARAENPETRIARTRFDARQEADAVVEFHEPVAQDQQVAVQCDGNGSLEADPMLFRRALSNLLSNALHYTPRGGRITISIEPRANGSVEITVADNGTGIPPEHLPRIFDRFYRADGARSRLGEGTGLGLAIVKSIMELHGGAVTIESPPGHGTMARLTFPPLSR